MVNSGKKRNGTEAAVWYRWAIPQWYFWCPKVRINHTLKNSGSKPLAYLLSVLLSPQSWPTDHINNSTAMTSSTMTAQLTRIFDFKVSLVRMQVPGLHLIRIISIRGAVWNCQNRFTSLERNIVHNILNFMTLFLSKKTHLSNWTLSPQNYAKIQRTIPTEKSFVTF